MLRCLIATLGKDAPGVNAAVRAVTRLASRRDLEVYGVKQGFRGVLNRTYVKLRESDVANILGRGGSLLGSSDYRLPVAEKEALDAIAASLKQFDLVVAIGGLGSFAILDRVYSHADLALTTTMFIPASVEGEFLDPRRARGPIQSSREDGAGVEARGEQVHAECIGADTAANTAIEAIERLRDQSYHTRTVFLVQTIGAKSNFLPVQIGVACGAHRVYLPSFPRLTDDDRAEIKTLYGDDFDPHRVDVRELVAWIGQTFETTRKKYLVVLIPHGLPLVGRVRTPGQEIHELHRYESIVTSMAPLELTALRVVDDLSLYFSGNDEVQVRHVLLDDLQRGGAPTARDRVLASMYGEAAVEEFLSLLHEQGAEARGGLSLLAIGDTSRVGWKRVARSEVTALFKGDDARAGGVDALPFLRLNRGTVSGYRPLALL